MWRRDHLSRLLTEPGHSPALLQRRYTWLMGIRIDPDPADAPARFAGERMLPMLRGLRLMIPLLRSAGQHGESNSAQSSPGVLGFNPGVARVLKLMLVFVCTCHWIGCVWWAVGELEQDGLMASVAVNQTASRFDPDSRDIWGPSPWLRETQHPATQYAHALLWGASLMTGFVPFG